MIKEEKPIFFKVVVIVVAILVVNLAVFSIKVAANKSLTGLAISEKMIASFKGISSFSKIFLTAQWMVLLVILLGSFLKGRDQVKKDVEDNLIGLDIELLRKQKGTDLDLLYNLLKEKKVLRASSVSRLFKVKKETVYGWFQILDTGNLGTIDYNSAKDPMIKINI